MSVAVAFGWKALAVFNGLVIAYFVLLNLFYLATSLLAFASLRRYARRLKSIDMDELLGVQSFPPVTLLAPAYNEEPTCVESIRSLLTLRHPAYDIIVVNDGSRDRTLDRLSEAFALQLCARAPMAHLPSKPVRGIYRSAVHPNLWVIDKVNGGKADSLNAGLNYCRTPLFCAIDADSLLEQDSLIRISRPFLEDDRTVAAGGIIRIVNDCEVRSGTVTRIRLPRSLLARFQVLEYLRAFLAGRVGWDALNATLIISGAFGMFRRAAVVEAGGYATDTVGEDMELVVRLRRRGFESGKDHRVAFVPDPVAWTECPETVRVLGRQRDRWQRGLMESIWRHRRMLFNPRYGRVGTLAFPYFFFLEMCGPVIEGAGYLGFVLAVATGRASLPFILAFLALAFAFGMALSVAAVALEELTFRRYPRARDLAQLFWLAILENVGYRQLSTYWRLKGIVSKVRGATGWGAMERRGFKPKPVG